MFSTNILISAAILVVILVFISSRILFQIIRDPFIRVVAKRYLWAKRSEAFITLISIISLLGVAVGVAVLTAVMAVMTGFETELRAKIIGATSHITVKSAQGRIFNWEGMEKEIASNPSVTAVSPFTYHQALIRSSYASQGVLLRGIKKGSFASDQIAGMLTEGESINDLFSPKPISVERDGAKNEVNLPGVLIGSELAKRLNLSVGDIVSLLSPSVSSSPFGLVPSYKRFIVSGMYKGLIDYENAVAFVSMQAAQDLFREGNAIYGFEVQINDMDKAPEIGKAIGLKTRELDPGIVVDDWTITNKPLWDAMRLEKRVYFLVLLLIIIMASFSIISTLVMIVLEKRKDIAVLMTLGADPVQVRRIFQMMGCIIGGIGTILGLCLGYAICISLRTFGFPLDERIFGMSELPIAILPANFMAVGVSAFLICCLATLYPASRASRIEPTQVLRG